MRPILSTSATTEPMEVPSSHAAQQGTLGVECEEALKSTLRQPQVELVLSRLRATHQLSIEATRCVRSVFILHASHAPGCV